MQQPVEGSKVILYSCYNCPGSQRARAYLRKHGIPFVEHNIEAEPEAAKAFEQLAGLGTPCLVVHGQRLLGFDPDELDAVWRNGR